MPSLIRAQPFTSPVMLAVFGDEAPLDAALRFESPPVASAGGRRGDRPAVSRADHRDLPRSPRRRNLGRIRRSAANTAFTEAAEVMAELAE
ncbi:hypothetical protein [Caulobacter segnis]|uniref:hypothetical protein n=1 Tax=Caulobacter segnis TaxID=88688 RepID=UPI0012EDA0AC|nr:hypothetical protein [Caulobacter segnis]